jgi:sec-independent protein translocase protein TatA
MMTRRSRAAPVEWRKYMGLAMSVPQLLIILVIVALIFGTKRLKEVGGDLGSAVKSFRKAMNNSADAEAEAATEPPKQLTRDEEKR